MRIYVFILFTLINGLSYAADQKSTDLIAAFEQQMTAESYQKIWTHYIQTDSPTEYGDLLASMPELKDPNFNSEKVCPELNQRVNSALTDHYASLALHYLSLRCSEALGNTSRANLEERIIDIITEVMVDHGSGESDADPYWVGYYTDVDQFMTLAGLKVVDKYLKTYQNGTFFQWVLYEDTETGVQEYFHFECTDYFNALLVDIERPKISDNPIADAFFQSNWKAAVPVIAFAEAGVPEAQILMGNLSVQMVEQFPEFINDALGYYDKASKQGSVIANGLYATAIFALNQQDKYSVAIDYLIDATEKNYQYATYLLATSYLLDVDGNDNKELADQLIQLLAQIQPTEEVYYGIAKILTEYNGRLSDNKLGIEYFKKSFDLGYVKAAYELGEKYINAKNGFEYSKGKGLSWLKKAAEQDSIDANVSLSYYYDGYRGVKENIDKAFQYASRAAELDGASGYNNLAATQNNFDSKYYDVESAVTNYKKAAEQGNRFGQYNLAKLYLPNSGIPADFKQAFELSEQLIKKEDQNGYLIQAIMYQNGWHVDKDINKARQYYDKISNQNLIIVRYNNALLYSNEHLGIANLTPDIKALKKAAKDSPTAAFLLAFYYQFGYKVSPNATTALKHFKKAGDLGLAAGYAFYADQYGLDKRRSSRSQKKNYRKYHSLAYEQGYMPSALVLRRFSRNEGDHESAFNYIKYAADRGYPYALFLMAEAYEKGVGTDANMSLALDYYKKASAAGQSRGLFELGWIYANDKTYKDLNQSIKYFTENAENGDTQSMYNLAKIYHDFDKEFSDIDKAIYWYARAEQEGHIKAGIRLGRMYLTGDDVAANPDVGFLYIKKYARDSQKDAYFWLARAYQHGLGVEQDSKKAKDLYKQLAELKHTNSLNNYAYLLYQESQTQRQYKNAMKYFLQAEEAGSRTAKMNIGWMHEHGQGVKTDTDKAMNYYVEATNTGSACAQYRLSLVARNGEFNELLDLEKANQLYDLVERSMQGATSIGVQDCLIEMPSELFTNSHKEDINTQPNIANIAN